MAVTNHERIGKAMELLRQGLGPFVEREVQDKIQAGAVRMDVIRRFVEDPKLADKPIGQWDVSGLLRIMWETWHDVFRMTLGHAERSLVAEIRDWRNKWAHQEPFSSDDADRALDSMTRLLSAVSAPQADEVGRMKMELRRYCGLRTGRMLSALPEYYALLVKPGVAKQQMEREVDD